MNYREAMEYIEEISKYGSVLGLDGMRELCKRLGNPQDSLKFIHIAGTNGKGSVLAYISTILKCAGYKVGRYISPTIREYRERIQVQGKMITQKELCTYLEKTKKICEEMVQEGFSHPTIFEIETAISFCCFLDKKCDFVVLETGLGGREDATNVISTPLVSVFASISMDHQMILGNTIEKITKEKAGIIKPQIPVVVMKQEIECVEEILQKEAERQKCRYFCSDWREAKAIKNTLYQQVFHYKNRKNLETTLAGIHQIANACLAVDVISLLQETGVEISEKAVCQGLKGTTWMGRFTPIAKKPIFVIDGAHNEDAAKKLAQSIRFYFTNKRIIYIMGILKDKEHEKIIRETCVLAEQIITITPPNNARAMHAYDLAKEVRSFHLGVTQADSLEEAVEMAYLFAEKDDVIIAFGSLSFLGPLMNIMENRETVRSKAHGKQRKN